MYLEYDETSLVWTELCVNIKWFSSAQAFHQGYTANKLNE